MKLVVFGLSISSSWGNGHATVWRGLAAALAHAGCSLVFFERDVPYYAAHRDLHEVPGGELVLYSSFDEVVPKARRLLDGADAAMTTSYCPDAVRAADLILSSRARVKAFYDLDAPVTVERARAGERIEYLPPYGLSPFDLVLSFTGGRALRELERRFGARRTAPLYGSVDPSVHRRVEPQEHYRADLSYLGTYAANRQDRLEQLFLAVAARLPQKTFVIGGAQYPADFPWRPNVKFVRHLPPSEHPAFYSSALLTLNVTRRPMAEMGYCPSARLFEAAACGVPVLTDDWEGLTEFFAPNEEIMVATSTDEAVEAVSLPREVLGRIGAKARERVLSSHTADHRARELIELLAKPARARGAQAEPALAREESP